MGLRKQHKSATLTEETCRRKTMMHECASALRNGKCEAAGTINCAQNGAPYYEM